MKPTPLSKFNYQNKWVLLIFIQLICVHTYWKLWKLRRAKWVGWTRKRAVDIQSYILLFSSTNISVFRMISSRNEWENWLQMDLSICSVTDIIQQHVNRFRNGFKLHYLFWFEFQTVLSCWHCPDFIWRGSNSKFFSNVEKFRSLPFYNFLPRINSYSIYTLISYRIS